MRRLQTIRNFMTLRAHRLAERLAGGRRLLLTEYPTGLAPRYGWDGAPVHQELAQIIASGRDRYASMLRGSTELLPALRAIPRASDDPAAARWENRTYSSLDVVVMYGEIIRRKPQVYLEVGSGHSTAFARRAITDAGLSTRIVSIDPAPRTEIDAICDELQRCSLTEADLSVMDDLRDNDVVLIDGSHLCTMGSDTVVAFLEMVPRLPAGTLLGIDDVFLPWDYHPTWERKMYGEQYLVAMMLLFSDEWEITFPSWWVGQDQELAPLVNEFDNPARTSFGLHGTTMWLTRRPAGHSTA